MDTDELTEQAYEVITRAYEMLDVLRAEIGASAEKYKTGDEFLKGTHKMLKRISRNPGGYLDIWNYLDSVDSKQFAEGIRGLIGHVERTLDMPRRQRGGQNGAVMARLNSKIVIIFLNKTVGIL